jgi:two-component system copper resistance phosphate regulon response regulator CusR
MKILIIEDNRRLSHQIKRSFIKQHVIDLADNGNDGEQKALEGEYAVIVLDLGLPDKSGQAVCKELRQLGLTTPILILTGQDKVESRISLLENGADDYLAKPFSMEELRARITALGRRTEQQYSDATLVLKDLTLNTSNREVSRSGTPIKLRRKEFDILEYLIINRGRAVTREMILRHAWEADKDSWNNTVDVHIKNLRDKVDRPFAQPLIKTEYGIGYMVEGAG